MRKLRSPPPWTTQSNTRTRICCLTPEPLSIRTAPTRCPKETQTNRSKPKCYLPFPLPTCSSSGICYTDNSITTNLVTYTRNLKKFLRLFLLLYLFTPNAHVPSPRLEPIPFLSFMHFLGKASHTISSLTNLQNDYKNLLPGFFPQPLSISWTSLHSPSQSSF